MLDIRGLRLESRRQREEGANAHAAITLVLTVALLTVVGCRPAADPQSPPADNSQAVWAVDLVRTLPGAQDDYVRSIETNWANARRLVAERGAVLSYRALVAAVDTARGWDVMLMTEYRDSTAHADREAIFREVFESSEFVAVEPARPSAEMREFMAGDVQLRAFVVGGR